MFLPRRNTFYVNTCVACIASLRENKKKKKKKKRQNLSEKNIDDTIETRDSGIPLIKFIENLIFQL